ncbi:MAG: DUF1772 domain-containing protein [Sphingobacteriales bacterium]|nr:MAG: DUF1772 domain-containing protein [Sphingobacteriales bacterium]
MKRKDILLLLAIVATGLIAGLFYAYEVSVNIAFRQLSDAEYTKAMQAINIAIINPSFMLSFMGTAFLLPIAAFVHRRSGQRRLLLLIAASLLYIVGTLGVTMMFNVPLNDQLAAFNLQTASAEQVSALRKTFAEPWNQWNTIRTTCNILAFVLATAAALSKPKIEEI